MLHIALREPVAYKLAIEFRGAGDKLYIPNSYWAPDPKPVSHEPS